jgi:hypothetical protein
MAEIHGDANQDRVGLHQRRAACRRFLNLAGIAACSVIGCAVSPQALGKLTAQVSVRNEQRYRTAETGLRAQGYVFADEEQRYARLPEEALRRCRAADPAGPRSAADAAETMVVTVEAMTAPNRPPPAAMQLNVAAADACRFFRDQTNQLAARRADGSGATRIIRMADSARLARDRHGELAIVAVSSRVVSRRHIRVKRTCDHMPTLQPDAIELGISIRVFVAPAPPPRVAMTVEEEVLDIECTDNTY